MKRLSVILAAIWIPMMLWSQNPTHTLTIEYRNAKALIEVRSVSNNKTVTENVVRNDTVRICAYQVEEGETYTIKINPNGNQTEAGNIYSEFTAWMRDGAVCSTSPELRMTVGKSDISLTAVLTHKVEMPYSPNANRFDASTGVLTLDEIRNGDTNKAFIIAKNRYQFEWDDVQSLVLIGKLNSAVGFEDLHYFNKTGYNMNNLQSIDLSQTSGMSILKGSSSLHSYFPKLEHIILGPDLDTIKASAFYGFGISTIDCYAVKPPICAVEYSASNGSFSKMTVSKDKVLVRVPPESVELYKQAKGWKDFPNIYPLYETSSIAVKLPTDVPEGYYEDMTVELTNLNNGFEQARRVLKMHDIVYSGLMRGSEYQAVLKNAYGQVMGQTASAELGEEDITLTFGKLLRTKDVTLKVTGSDGKDVTSDVLVLWTDESDKALGHSYRLKAVAEGVRLNCKVTLTGELAQQYVAPGAVPITVDGEGANLLTVALQPIQQLTLHGQVKDQQTGESIAEATVAVTQQSGNQSQSVTVTTDDEGRYELQGTNMAGELSVTVPGYLSKTVEFASPASDGALPTVELEPFNGVIVNTWLTYTAAAKDGEEGIVIDGFDDENGDVVYEVYNQTKEAAVENFIVKGKALYIISGVDTGDELNITAASRGDYFSKVSATCTIGNNGTAFVTLSIRQKGVLEAVLNSDANLQVMGVLYDSDGRFSRSNIYKSTGLRFSNLASGDYTLVSMSYNYLMSRILQLSTLDDMGLVDGTDYVKNTVLVQDGRIATVSVADVPVLDEEKIRFTDSRTYFIADRNTISIGQSVVIQSKLSFAKQYAERIGNVEFLLDMPDEIDLVENSPLAGSAPSSYRIEDGRYVFPVENMEDGIFRMCLLPKNTGEFRITGSVRFILDGARIVQPIGTVWVLTQGFTISEPAFVTSSTLYVSGTAPLVCKNVEIYDHNNLVGTAKVDGTGCWSVSVKFHANKPTDCHAIKARTSTQETGVIESEVRYVAFKDNHHMAKIVVMVPPHSKKPVVFNFYENSISAKSYTYVLQDWWQKTNVIPYTTKFNFLALFDDLDESKTNDVKIKVLASDGTTRTLKAKYDAEKQCYYASSKYPNSSKLPVSAYAYVEAEYSPVSEEEKAAEAEASKNVLTKLKKAAIKAAKKGEIEVLSSDEKTINMRYTVSGKTPFAFTMKEMDYDEAAERLMDDWPFISHNETDTFAFTFINGTDEAEMLLLDVNGHSAMRMGITYAETDDLGAMPGKRPVAPRMKRPSAVDMVNAWGTAASIGSDILEVVGMKDYIDAIFFYDNMMRSRHRRMARAIDDEIEKANAQLESYCIEDGEIISYPPDRREYFKNRTNKMLNDFDELASQWGETYKSIMVDLCRKVAWDVTFSAATSGIGKYLGSGMKAAGLVKTADHLSAAEEAAQYAVGSTLQLGKDWLDKHYINPNIEEMVSVNFDRHFKEYKNTMDLQGESIIRALKFINEEIADEDPCDDEDEDEEDEDDDDEDDEDDDDDDDNDDEDNNDDFDDDYSDNRAAYERDRLRGFPPTSTWWCSGRARPLIDPQGYVYEAVPSNRVEGATATIYYKDFMLNQNGNSSGERDAMWDAENYDQVNPQTTGSDGMYQWDVPQGIWQVRVQKEGYENNASEWLPVPPPQLDVNIPIVRARLPKVETAHAYEDAVTVKFDNYMQPVLLTTEQITVKENGTAVEGVISLTDEEEAPDGAAYASQLRFVPATPFTATEVTLIVSGQVKSYAGIEMDEPYEAVLPIERELKSLEAAKKVYVEYQGTGTVRVKGTPAAAAAGKKVTVTCLSGIIASATQTEVVLDANGEAHITIQGDLPGEEIVTFTMEDPELTTSTLVKVVTELPLVIEAPEASVATETEVAKGAEITLTCKTEGAAIYFTLDGSSPLDSDTRILYDGTPVVINAETTLAAVAVIDGKGSSDVRTWHYTVSVETRTEEVSSGSMQVTPARVRDSFVVTGVEGVFSLRVYSMSGKLLLTLEQVRSGQRVDTSALPAGIHLVVVNTPAASFTRRIVKN
ncbi:MAG: carboxypeptidase regulatory-like domain-containing protein [Paludibacteraceae bacterium]|nr:carboxypeptidase regulatory-like domain-containing protein [Paludibacteraceae bacterium]